MVDGDGGRRKAVYATGSFLSGGTMKSWLDSSLNTGPGLGWCGGGGVRLNYFSAPLNEKAAPLERIKLNKWIDGEEGRDVLSCRKVHHVGPARHQVCTLLNLVRSSI